MQPSAKPPLAAKTKILLELLRYGVVSVISFAFDFGLLYVLTDLAGIHYLLSATISYGIGMVVNYYLSVLWVFEHRNVKNRAVEFSLFTGVGVAGLGVNALILWTWTDLLGLHYMTGRLVSAVIGYVWKYVARRALLFRKRAATGQGGD